MASLGSIRRHRRLSVRKTQSTAAVRPWPPQALGTYKPILSRLSKKSACRQRNAAGRALTPQPRFPIKKSSLAAGFGSLEAGMPFQAASTELFQSCCLRKKVL
jgi:hypothetical protein